MELVLVRAPGSDDTDAVDALVRSLSSGLETVYSSRQPAAVVAARALATAFDAEHRVTDGFDADQGATPDGVRRKATTEIGALITAHPGGRVALVSDGSVVNAYVAALLGADGCSFHDPAPGGITRIRASRSGHVNLISLNDTSHLRMAARSVPHHQEA